ncbi:S-adenosyl-L-methionine-dependent methyltransferase [Aspergillus spinulosporus]
MASAGNERFNDEAAEWDKNPSVQEATRLAFDTLKPIIQTLSEQKHSTAGTGLEVLEVGCGTGLLTLRVAPLVHEIIAVDPAYGMIDALKAKINRNKEDNSINAQQSNRESGSNVVPICRLLEDPEDPALPPQNVDNPEGLRRKFDLILSHLVMHHVPDLKEFLSTLRGCLTPGGRIALTDFEDFGPEAIKFHPPTKLEGVERHGIPARWIEDLMKEVGFQEVKVSVGWTLTKSVEDWEGNKPGDTLQFPFLLCEGLRP